MRLASGMVVRLADAGWMSRMCAWECRKPQNTCAVNVPVRKPWPNDWLAMHGQSEQCSGNLVQCPGDPWRFSLPYAYCIPYSTAKQTVVMNTAMQAVSAAQNVLHRVVLGCYGKLSAFGRTHAWLPSQGTWHDVSSLTCMQEHACVCD